MSALVATHAFAALLSILLGARQVLAAKGGPTHRLVGRVWAVAMLYTAFSSFWIKELRPGEFSVLHVLSVVTIVSVALGVWNVRAGRVKAHVGNMAGAYIGLLFAFAFAVAIPSRDLPTFVLTRPGDAATAAVLLVLTAAAVLGLGHLAGAGRPGRASRQDRIAS